MRNCRHCGEEINESLGLPHGSSMPRQTLGELLGQIGRATHVRTSGGLLSVECWIEHMQWGLDYVRYERRVRNGRLELVELPYADAYGGGIGAFGIWPLIEREWV